jgi:hypothetical protein
MFLIMSLNYTSSFRFKNNLVLVYTQVLVSTNAPIPRAPTPAHAPWDMPYAQVKL